MKYFNKKMLDQRSDKRIIEIYDEFWANYTNAMYVPKIRNIFHEMWSELYDYISARDPYFAF